jgi:hypothetical protein
MDVGGMHLWRYDAKRRTLVDATADFGDTIAAWRSRLRPEPLSVALRYDGRRRVLAWQFGPATGAHFTLVGRAERLPAPWPSGALRRDSALPECSSASAATLPTAASPTRRGCSCR